MKKFGIFSAVAAAVTLSSGVALAASDMNHMEKCKVVDAHGKGLVKEGKGDCKEGTGSCKGTNKAGDPNAFVVVKKGECAKINAGDFSGVTQVTKDKIEGAK